MKNESVKKPKEVKECSRRKAQNCHAKKLHKKDTHVYNNCYELRSRAIKKHPTCQMVIIAQKRDLFCFGPPVVFTPPVTNYMLLYST